MFDVDEISKSLALQPSRRVYSRVIFSRKTNGEWEDIFVISGNDNLVSAYVNIGDSSGGFTIGAAYCARLSLKIAGNADVQDGDRAILRVGFLNSDGSESKRISLGWFYVDSVKKSAENTIITGYDKMIRSSKNYKSKLSYPAKVSEILSEISTKISAPLAADTSIPYDASVPEKPVKGKDDDGNDIYYSIREMLQMLGTIIGCNFFINAGGELAMTSFTNCGETFRAENSMSLTLDDRAYEVKSIVWNTSGVPESADDEKDASGAVEFTNPLEVVKEPVLHALEQKLIGIIYFGGKIKRQGCGWFEPGDIVMTFTKGGAAYPIMVSGIDYTVENASFVETIYSSALTSEQENYKLNDVSGIKSKNQGPSADGALTRYKMLADNKVECNGVTYTADFDTAGFISKITDSFGANILPEITGGITNAALHNAVFWAAAVSKGIAKDVGNTMPIMRGIHAYFDYEIAKPSGGLWPNYISGGSPMQLFGGTGSVAAINTGSCLRFEGAEQQYGLYDFGEVSDLTIYYVMRAQPVVASKNITAGGIASLSKVNQSEINFWTYTDRVVVGTYGTVDQTTLKSKTFEDGFSVLAVRKLSGVLGCFCDGEYKGNRNQSKDLKPRLTIGGYERAGTMVWLPSGSTEWQYAGPTEVLFVALSSTAHTDSEIFDNMAFLKRRFNII